MDELRVAFANVAGGRLVGPDRRYLAEDRTADFGRALAGLAPDVLIVTELNCDGDQLEQLSAAAMPGRRANVIRHAWSDSHVPGVDRLGVGIASPYPLQELPRIDLPNPSFEMLHWSTGDRLDWHEKGFLVARGDFGPLGQVDIVGGQICPVHMARSADGVEYSYAEGPGRAFGQEMTAYLGRELAARGVQRAVIAGDLNMPNPGDFFSRLGPLELADGFGEPAPATTPDGRSIDRVFLTQDLLARDAEVLRLPGADHFPCACRVTSRDGGRSPLGAIREQDLTRPPTRPGPPAGRRTFGRG
ncbi:endonuclease/exonuclease/phosphatase family metal-dependent hydrolase [Kribbella amoyensis]|uniref:Endonuclease/exonuclease/phosphatase family metal-dependent hydrolase n=1 Tax=Kribbella amoyensis TaxID=996641 RepID=A0A561B834_9ACTN|nr:endonuclease/exonuclease/phosphatase family protein [Kribbella amoyensis]TWD75126.1 endonuclease/exonuclease/phosphatase family metal-dependent hydrolase [Kribbella amoyensis]